MEPVEVCKRCILDSSVPGVSFDAWGICNHCRLHDRLEQRYALNTANRTAFEQLLNDIRAKGKGRRYDCIVGLSGGVHFDCAYKPFGTFIDNEKFNRHPKKVALAALVRAQELSREEALEEARRDAEGPPHRPGVEYCMQRLGITPEELETIVAAAPKTFLNYRTYYSIFSFFRLPIRIACTMKLVPETLYEKLFTVV